MKLPGFKIGENVSNSQYLLVFILLHIIKQIGSLEELNQNEVSEGFKLSTVATECLKYASKLIMNDGIMK